MLAYELLDPSNVRAPARRRCFNANEDFLSGNYGSNDDVDLASVPRLRVEEHRRFFYFRAFTNESMNHGDDVLEEVRPRRHW
jgi:hypothetical protein